MTDPQQVIGEMQLRMDALASQMQALNIAHQSQAQQNAQLQQEKQELDQRLTGVMALLQQSLQQTANVGVAQGQVPPLQSAGTPAGSSKPVNHIDVLKSVKQSQIVSILTGSRPMGTVQFPSRNIPGFAGRKLSSRLGQCTQAHQFCRSSRYD